MVRNSTFGKMTFKRRLGGSESEPRGTWWGALPAEGAASTEAWTGLRWSAGDHRSQCGRPVGRLLKELLLLFQDGKPLPEELQDLTCAFKIILLSSLKN